MTFSGSNSAADAVSRLDIRDTVDEKPAPDHEQNSVINVPECKCGMPLCICVASAPEPDPAPLQGLREAIKNSDTAAVRKLLSEGVDANYCDKQGLSLLHLAALFNQTDIAFILMDNGANLEYKNQQGETALDCAPTTLQYRMKQKMENGA
ncbi:hypothetical protein C5167_008745 [Papaver somniferum]|uniref:Uncharacterized protein n=1 Tax=Papaver somniferum TaxID=3469 RepID=A0A4Y7JVF1_PAPSO|nr:hypothetical protein C5167_008745 [Papaver somniferum]